LLPDVAAFDCGDAVWERQVSEWIQAEAGTGGAADAITFFTHIWVYRDPAGELVGFGSLAEAIHWPAPGTPRHNFPRASVIPYFGIDRRFHGQPPGPREQRFAYRIFRDLMAEAEKVQAERPLLILEVDTDNVRAERFYRESFGFADISPAEFDPETGRSYKWMGRALNPPI
jgi:ribosomal protein S18 acetylase RimI-like enzyme